VIEEGGGGDRGEIGGGAVIGEKRSALTTSPSVVISGHQWASVVISGHQMSSAAAHSTHCQMPRPPCNLDRPWARHMAMCPRETRTAPAGFVRSSRTGRWRR